MKRCVIIGASPPADYNYIKAYIKQSDYIICADGGYNIAKFINVRPNLIVGDLDSVKEQIPEEIETIKLPTKKDDTDMFACAREALNRGYKSITLLCATGNRLDHTIANIGLLLYLSQNNAYAKIIDENTEIFILTKGTHGILNRKGKTISVFPALEECCKVTYKGLLYSLDKAVIKNNYPYGISNEIISNDSKIEVIEGTALGIITN